MRSFLSTFLALSTALLLPQFAAADDDTPPKPPADRLEARFGTGFVSGSAATMTVRRADVSAGIMYFPGGLPLALGTSVHFGPSFLELNGPIGNGISIDASLARWTNLSLEAEAELTVYKDRLLSFDLYGSMEMSAFADRLAFTRADLVTSQGTFDVTPFLDRHFDLRFGWNRMEAGVIAKVRMGAFVPRMAIGFQRMLLRLTAETDDEGKFVLTNLGDRTGSVERLYEEDFTVIKLAPGTDWRLGKRMTLSLDMFIMPTSEALFFGSNLAAHFPF